MIDDHIRDAQNQQKTMVQEQEILKSLGDGTHPVIVSIKGALESISQATMHDINQSVRGVADQSGMFMLKFNELS